MLVSLPIDPNEYKTIFSKLSRYFESSKVSKNNGVEVIFLHKCLRNKNNRVVTEKSKLSPTTSYGKSKKIEEKPVKIANKDFKVIILEWHLSEI